jgi:ribosomal protein L12E/L44/L45/RPP1/RPP2
LWQLRVVFKEMLSIIFSTAQVGMRKREERKEEKRKGNKRKERERRKEGEKEERKIRGLQGNIFISFMVFLV